MKATARRKRVDYDTVRRLAGALPGVEEGTSYGTPALRVRGKFFARLREDGETLVLKLTFEERDILMQVEPQTFYITDHYRDYPSILVRLPRVRLDELRDLLTRAWRLAAPKRLVATFDESAP